jgi:tetratricopeptide (TPR) repeat protein
MTMGWQITAKRKREARSAGIVSPPAPARCILDLWELGIEQHEETVEALVQLVVARPELISTITDAASAEVHLRAAFQPQLAGRNPTQVCQSTLALAGLLELTGRASEAEAVFIKALHFLKTVRGLDAAETLRAARALDELLVKQGKAATTAQSLRAAALLARSDADSLHTSRDTAFEAFQSGRYAEAEAVYRHMLRHNFELANTHCHMTRLLLAVGREPEAIEHARLAWENRDSTSQYIVARILYLKALLAVLGGTDASPILTHLKQTMHNPDATLEWLVDPVLERLRPRLTEITFAFFKELSDALRGRFD